MSDRILTNMDCLVYSMILMLQIMLSSLHSKWFLLMDISLLPCQCGCMHQLQHVYALDQMTRTILRILISIANFNTTNHHKSHQLVRYQQWMFLDFQMMLPLFLITTASRYSTRYISLNDNIGCTSLITIMGL